MSGKNHGFHSGNLVTSPVRSSLKNPEKILFDSNPALRCSVGLFCVSGEGAGSSASELSKERRRSKTAHQVQIPGVGGVSR